MKRRLREILAKSLPKNELLCVYNSYDIVGDIVILRLTDTGAKYLTNIAEVVMNEHKNVKAVFAQTGSVHGDFRLRKLEYVVGEKRTATAHKEYGCLFNVDVAKCYFSPRLLHERMRIARQVKRGEIVVNMFAGIGCFSIIIAKYSNAKKVYSIDVNPAAVRYMKENTRTNRAYGKVIPLLGDAKEVIEKRFFPVANRVLMPLPEKACEYLPYAVSALKRVGGCIHYYDFQHADKNENPIEKAKSKAAARLKTLNANFEFSSSRIVRTTGPNWYQIVLDINIISENVL